MLARLTSLIARLRRRRAFEADLDTELGFHLAAREDDLARRGLSREAARRQARIELGGAERFKDECRQAVGLRIADELSADLRYAWRGLRRDRGFTAIAVTVLGLTIGANTALFTFLDAFFLKPLPIAAADRHVELSRQTPAISSAGWSLEEIEVMRAAGAGVIEQGYANGTRRPTLIADEPLPLYAEAVTASFFTLAEPRFARGRGFDASADWKGSPNPVVVLSYPGWRRLTASDPAIVGKTLPLDGMLFTVAGVTDESFPGFDLVIPDLWMTASAAEQVLARKTPNQTGAAQSGFYNFSALLKPGVSREQAADVLTRALAQIPTRDPALRDARVRVRCADDPVSRERRGVAAGAGAAGGVRRHRPHRRCQPDQHAARARSRARPRCGAAGLARRHTRASGPSDPLRKPAGRRAGGDGRVRARRGSRSARSTPLCSSCSPMRAWR